MDSVERGDYGFRGALCYACYTEEMWNRQAYHRNGAFNCKEIYNSSTYLVLSVSINLCNFRKTGPCMEPMSSSWITSVMLERL